jgi:hypothetical protein
MDRRAFTPGRAAGADGDGVDQGGPEAGQKRHLPALRRARFHDVCDALGASFGQPVGFQTHIQEQGDDAAASHRRQDDVMDRQA